MNLYKISQNKYVGYDVYDSAVVCAKNEDAAKLIHPDKDKGCDWVANKEYDYDWEHPKNVFASLIGIADESIKEGAVVCASYNAG